MLILTICIIHFFALIVPGPDFLLTSRTGLQGVKSNIVKVAMGVTLGNLIWCFFSLLGLQILFQFYPILNQLFQFIGSIYLLYLAYTILKQPKMVSTQEVSDKNSYFLKGLMTNLSNPKALLYFTSIFSVLFKQMNSWLAFIMIIVLTIETGLWFLTLGFGFSHSLIKKFYYRHQRKIDLASAGVFSLFAILLLVKLYE